jgi:hypothetical protein
MRGAEKGRDRDLRPQLINDVYSVVLDKAQGWRTEMCMDLLDGLKACS